MSRRRKRVKAPIPYEEACEKCKSWSEDWTTPYCPFAEIYGCLTICNDAYTDVCKSCGKGIYLYSHIDIDHYPREFTR